MSLVKIKLYILENCLEWIDNQAIKLFMEAEGYITTSYRIAQAKSLLSIAERKSYEYK